ncbi:MAG: hypothetical protein KDA17_05805 [Candidatus Saccharibacteria bacterium]|nr:hypothetical protein [Candidatus Saccharibacteria bacterium]
MKYQGNPDKLTIKSTSSFARLRHWLIRKLAAGDGIMLNVKIGVQPSNFDGDEIDFMIGMKGMIPNKYVHMDNSSIVATTFDHEAVSKPDYKTSEAERGNVRHLDFGGRPFRKNDLH